MMLRKLFNIAEYDKVAIKTTFISTLNKKQFSEPLP